MKFKYLLISLLLLTNIFGFSATILKEYSQWESKPKETIWIQGSSNPTGQNEWYKIIFTQDTVLFTSLMKDSSGRILSNYHPDDQISMDIKLEINSHRVRITKKQWDFKGNSRVMGTVTARFDCKGPVHEPHFDNKRENLYFTTITSLGVGETPNWILGRIKLSSPTTQLIKTNSRGVRHPTPLPDNRHILFYSFSSCIRESPAGNAIFKTEVKQLDIHSGKTSLLADAGILYETDTHPFAIQPNGNKIAYRVKKNGTHEPGIEILDLSTGKKKYLGEFTNELTWSPDGNKYAYSNREGIWINEEATSNTIQLTKNGNHGEYYNHDYLPKWSNNGNYIAFRREGKPYPSDWANAQLWIIEVKTLKACCPKTDFLPWTYFWVNEDNNYPSP